MIPNFLCCSCCYNPNLHVLLALDLSRISDVDGGGLQRRNQYIIFGCDVACDDGGHRRDDNDGRSRSVGRNATALLVAKQARSGPIAPSIMTELTKTNVIIEAVVATEDCRNKFCPKSCRRNK